MKRVLLTEPAREDLLSTWEFIADRSGIDSADKLAAQFASAVKRLARTPSIGHTRPDLASDNVRFFRLHSYLIVFRVVGRQLQVLRALHAARDISWLLSANRED